jgi:hypothetical protein
VEATSFSDSQGGLQKAEAKAKPKKAVVDHPTGTMDLATGPHKEKGFEMVEIVTKGDVTSGVTSSVTSGGATSGVTSHRANLTQEVSSTPSIVMATLEVREGRASLHLLRWCIFFGVGCWGGGGRGLPCRWIPCERVFLQESRFLQQSSYIKN